MENVANTVRIFRTQILIFSEVSVVAHGGQNRAAGVADAGGGITICGRGILVYIIIGVVMYSPTMKLVASLRRTADEGVLQLRNTV